MEKMKLNDFIRYAKEQFNCNVILKTCDKPDTFESIFGISFLNDGKYSEKVDGFAEELCYENVSIDVKFDFCAGMDNININAGLAA